MTAGMEPERNTAAAAANGSAMRLHFLFSSATSAREAAAERALVAVILVNPAI
jgi:hypothetical protein